MKSLRSLQRNSRRAADRPLHIAQRSEPARLEDVLISYKLHSRRNRKPNAQAENFALHSLARVMASSPDKLIDTLLLMALELCNAETAGLSLLETTAEGEQVFRWTNVAGALSEHVGGSTPRNFSPCGVCLDKNAPQLFGYPGRRFQYLNEISIPIVEALVIPIHMGDETPGTIWILTHDGDVKFDSEHVRIMTGLAEFTSSALRLAKAYEVERRARKERDKEIAEHQQTRSKLESVLDRRTSQLQQLTGRLP